MYSVLYYIFNDKGRKVYSVTFHIKKRLSTQDLHMWLLEIKD